MVIRRVVSLVLFACMASGQYLALFSHAQGQSKNDKRMWRAAIYHGLIIGQTKRDDMLRIYGAPSITERSEEYDPENADAPIWDIYQDIYENRVRFKDDILLYSGKDASIDDITIETDAHTKYVTRIIVSVRNWTRPEIIRKFGENFIGAVYKPCDGFDRLPVPDNMPVPTYRIASSKKPQILEYPEKGILVDVAESGCCTIVYYTSNPMALARKADCSRELDRRKNKPAIRERSD